jgi:hypothetical protein
MDHLAPSPYERWRFRLAEYQRYGKVLRADPLIPDPGTYRVRVGAEWLPVHIWDRPPDGNGEIKFAAKLGFYLTEWRNVWPRCAATPVSSAAYRHHQQTGKWPDAAEADEIPTGANLAAASLAEQTLARIVALETAAIAWHESIGAAIVTQDHADRAANYAAKFLELELMARKDRMEEMRPYMAEVEASRARWSPVEARAERVKRTIKTKWLLPFLSLAKAAEDSSATTPKAGSTNHKRAAIAMRVFISFSDIRAFIRWLMDNAPKLSKPMQKAASDVARELARKGHRPPGVEVREEETVR